MLGYIEIPVNIKYEIPYSKTIMFNPFVGPIFTFGVVDLTHFDKKELFNVYTPGQSNLSNYDFWFEEGSGHEGFAEAGILSIKAATAGLNLGFQIGFKKYDLEFRYVLDGRKVYHLENLSEVHYSMHSIYFLFSF